jgi:hypothetical protein
MAPCATSTCVASTRPTAPWCTFTCSASSDAPSWTTAGGADPGFVARGRPVRTSIASGSIVAGGSAGPFGRRVEVRRFGIAAGFSSAIGPKPSAAGRAIPAG